MKTGRNDPCPCGSGKKFKKCCGSEGLRAVGPVETEAYDPVEAFWYSRGELARQGCPRFLGDLLAATEMVAGWLAESPEEEPLGTFLEAEANYARILEAIVEDGDAVEDYLAVRGPFDLDVGARARPPRPAPCGGRAPPPPPPGGPAGGGACPPGKAPFVSVEKKGKQK